MIAIPTSLYVAAAAVLIYVSWIRPIQVRAKRGKALLKEFYNDPDSFIQHNPNMEVFDIPRWFRTKITVVVSSRLTRQVFHLSPSVSSKQQYLFKYYNDAYGLSLNKKEQEVLLAAEAKYQDSLHDTQTALLLEEFCRRAVLYVKDISYDPMKDQGAIHSLTTKMRVLFDNSILRTMLGFEFVSKTLFADIKAADVGFNGAVPGDDAFTKVAADAFGVVMQEVMEWMENEKNIAIASQSIQDLISTLRKAQFSEFKVAMYITIQIMSWTTNLRYTGTWTMAFLIQTPKLYKLVKAESYTVHPAGPSIDAALHLPKTLAGFYKQAPLLMSTINEVYRFMSHNQSVSVMKEDVVLGGEKQPLKLAKGSIVVALDRNLKTTQSLYKNWISVHQFRKSQVLAILEN